ncbi:hypothetical protein [Flavobacterium beibuense]|uniref:Uncharacterized protein n=1 Tax=Flavobacterium beibuense F44-8 TaxID=1406840 RepID=A0A0A2LSA3_9FLAO|nr:hypothetical protein [Flavobacterium beibuense]KGO83177.1 hypothetical protein Q763_03980 [Flavobacterium beibuense F44-8]
MKLRFKILLVIYFILMLFALVAVIIGYCRHKDENVYIKNTVDYQLNGLVNREGHYHNNKAYGYFLGISNDSLNMFLITESSLSYDKERGSIGSFIEIGDSIYKDKNSKTVTVYRNKKIKCTFILE